MGIAAAVGQGGQLAKHRDRDAGAQGGLELGHGGDHLVVEEAHNPVGGEVNGIHNVILTPDWPLSSVILTFWSRPPRIEGQQKYPDQLWGFPSLKLHGRLRSSSGTCVSRAYYLEVIYARALSWYFWFGAGALK